MKLSAGTLLILILSSTASAWVQSVEFPWNNYPPPLWERELVRLKNIGMTHVSLPQSKDAAQLAAVIRIVRRLDLEADLEGRVPESLQPLMKQHGGPLTESASTPVRISALAPDALVRSHKLLASGTQPLLWTDVTDTLGAAGFHAGAVNFSGQEGPAAIALRRSAQLVRYWGETLRSLHEMPGTTQYSSENGTSFLAVRNETVTLAASDQKAFYAPLKRTIVLPNVTVPAHDVLWLPVNVPLMAGPLCKACTAFATVDHLVYATAELTAMEYENGILAMEFSAPSAGEVILQLSRQPSGPLVAGGKPTEFDWDEHALRARLPIPKGTGPGNHVRIGLAIEPPDATAFFKSARVLLIGETNNLLAEFSSTAIAQRSRLRSAPEMAAVQEATKNGLETIYRIRVPDTVVPGDHAELSIEADGSQMSHVHPQFLKPAAFRFPDSIAIRIGTSSSLPVFPATIPVNQRSGREVTVGIRNNAPEIRTFTVQLEADGLQFSPATMNVVVGASVTRDITFRIFSTGASIGVHTGEARLTGAATVSEPLQFLVIPPAGAVALSSGGFTLLESEKYRASFLPGRWLEMFNKENGQSSIPVGGIVFHPGTLEPAGDALIFGGQQRFRMQDLESLAPRPRK